MPTTGPWDEIPALVDWDDSDSDMPGNEEDEMPFPLTAGTYPEGPPPLSAESLGHILGGMSTAEAAALARGLLGMEAYAWRAAGRQVTVYADDLMLTGPQPAYLVWQATRDRVMVLEGVLRMANLTSQCQPTVGGLIEYCEAMTEARVGDAHSTAGAGEARSSETA